ncbi:MAG: hypothetical protein IT353_05105 [Gemmatimonadaceae bacterium]|nr:hypothetical protein [Gemmatimonadaceae bacterium]
MGLTRTEWLRRASRATVGLALGGSTVTAAGCGEQQLAPLEDPESGHLVVRTGEPVFAPTLGVHELGLGTTRDGVRFVPSTYRADEALPLVLTLHGYGSDGYAGLRSYLTARTLCRQLSVMKGVRGCCRSGRCERRRGVQTLSGQSSFRSSRSMHHLFSPR